MLDVQILVIVPTDIPPLKLAAIKEYGAQVVFYDRVFEDRYAFVEKFSREYGWTVLPPYDHKDVIAGQGTVVKELIDEVGPLDCVVIPVGGGGLISGSAVVVNELLPNCTVIGVEPETANDAQQSLHAGKLLATRLMPSTIADGARARRLGNVAWPIIQKYVHTIETVSDKELCLALRFFVERMKMIVEPTACLAPAAVFSQKIAVEGKRVGIIVSGGNVDANVLSSCLKRL